MLIRDRDQLGESRVVESQLTELGPPDAVENLSVPAKCRAGQIITSNTRLAVGEENVRALIDLPFDHFEPLARPAKVRLAATTPPVNHLLPISSPARENPSNHLMV
jgi:hypothetical protein